MNHKKWFILATIISFITIGVIVFASNDDNNSHTTSVEQGKQKSNKKEYKHTLAERVSIVIEKLQQLN